METRRELLVDGSNIAALYLDKLLRTQERLSSAERRVLYAQVELELALVSQQHAHGQLRTRTVDRPTVQGVQRNGLVGPELRHAPDLRDGSGKP